MVSSSSRSGTTKKLFASLAILAAVGVFVSFGVFSAFSQTQSNTSQLTSATFALTQVPASGNLLSNITSLLPGDTITRCVQVTNDSSVPVTVDAVPSMSNVSGALNAVATMAITEVSGVDTTSASTIKNCTPSGASLGAVGTVLSSTLGNALSTQHLSAAGSGLNWAAGESHVYKLVIALPSSVTDAATYAGKQVTAGVDFTATQAGSGSAR